MGRWLSPEASADLSIFPAKDVRVSPALRQGTSTSSTVPWAQSRRCSPSSLTGPANSYGGSPPLIAVQGHHMPSVSRHCFRRLS